MSLTLHWIPFSSAGISTAVLDELEHGLAAPLAQRIEHSFKDGSLRTAAYRAINPCGRVPALEHDGVAIFESGAITIYLGETFGVERTDGDGKPLESLYPALGPRRGEAMKWIIWSNLCLGEPGSRLTALNGQGTNAEEIEKLSEEVKADRAETARRELARWLGVLDQGLEGRAFLLGDGYCLADTHVHAIVSFLAIIGVDIEACGNVRAWAERVGGRPALKEQ